MRIGADLLFFLRSLPSTPSSNGDAYDASANSQYPRAVVLQNALEYFSSRVMTLIYLTYTLLISAKMTVGHSVVQCWAPQQFTKAWEEYTEQVCWMQPKTIWAAKEPWKSTLLKHYAPGILAKERHENVDYYQWMPYTFMALAALHPLPSFVWRIFVSKDERFLNQVVIQLAAIKKEGNETRREQLWKEVCHFSASLQPLRKGRENLLRRMLHFPSIGCAGLRWRLLPIKYIVYKFILVSWFLCQCYFFSRFAQLPNGVFFGANILYFNWLYGDISWQISGLFPRIVRCDFNVHDLGNDRTHSVQCALPMNMLYEKMLMISWCVLMTMVVGVLLSLIAFLLRNIVNTHWRSRSNRSYPDAKCSHLRSPLKNNPSKASDILNTRRWDQIFLVDCLRDALLDNCLVWEWWMRCEAIQEDDDDDAGTDPPHSPASRQDKRSDFHRMSVKGNGDPLKDINAVHLV